MDSKNTRHVREIFKITIKDRGKTPIQLRPEFLSGCLSQLPQLGNPIRFPDLFLFPLHLRRIQHQLPRIIRKFKNQVPLCERVQDLRQLRQVPDFLIFGTAFLQCEMGRSVCPHGALEFERIPGIHLELLLGVVRHIRLRRVGHQFDVARFQQGIQDIDQILWLLS